MVLLGRVIWSDTDMKYVFEYIVNNYILLIMLGGMLMLTAHDVFLGKSMIMKLRVAMLTLFSLSVFEEVEELFSRLDHPTVWRILFSAICYSLRPIIVLLIIALVCKRLPKFVLIPAAINVLLSFSALFSNVVFYFNELNSFQRGPLGYSAYVVSVLYILGLLVVTIRTRPDHSKEESTIAFFITGTAIGAAFMAYKGYDQLANPTYAVEIMLYYLYTYGQFTKRDGLTGLYNRQSFYGDMEKNPDAIAGVVSIDMNELKWLNDNCGHAAGDKALKTVSEIFVKCAKESGKIYRIGGDEFIIFYRKRFANQMPKIVEDMRKAIDDAGYSCAFGLSEGKAIKDMIREADELMYQDKARIKAQGSLTGRMVRFRE